MPNIIHIIKVRKLSETGSLVPVKNSDCPYYKENEKKIYCYDGKTDLYCKHIIKNAACSEVRKNFHYMLQCNYTE